MSSPFTDGIKSPEFEEITHFKKDILERFQNHKPLKFFDYFNHRLHINDSRGIFSIANATKRECIICWSMHVISDAMKYFDPDSDNAFNEAYKNGDNIQVAFERVDFFKPTIKKKKAKSLQRLFDMTLAYNNLTIKNDDPYYHLPEKYPVELID